MALGRRLLRNIDIAEIANMKKQVTWNPYRARMGLTNILFWNSTPRICSGLKRLGIIVFSFSELIAHPATVFWPTISKDMVV